MDETSQRLLRLIRPDRKSNWGPLRQRLVDEGLPPEQVEDCKRELVRAGFVEEDGGRVGRIAHSPETWLELLLPREALVYTALSESLEPQVEIRQRISAGERPEPEEFREILSVLAAFGLAERGGGQGGTARKIPLGELEAPAEPPEHAEAAAAATDEESLYPALRDWLREEIDPDPFVFARVAITARGGVRQVGKWMRPDVTRVTVANLPHVPGAILEVSTFEVKTRDGADVAAVYEAAAHQRVAHLASVVIEVEDGATLDSTIVSESGRLGIGVYTQTRAGQITLLREPEARFPGPGPAEMDRLIGQFLNALDDEAPEDRVRDMYRLSLRG